MLFNLAQSFRPLTMSPVAHVVDQAHKMARRRLLADGGAAPRRSANEKAEPADFVLPPDADAVEVAKAVRQKLGMPDGDDPLHPLEQRKLGGHVTLGRRCLLRFGNGRFDSGRAFMNGVIGQLGLQRQTK